ncbi:MAG: MotA/TolQ/ExbB proton channel family protein [Planctomycetes bacterium]|nr:MotA/TolQ/ExbB proton channel family protein [Planctomycetota bacterium]
MSLPFCRAWAEERTAGEEEGLPEPVITAVDPFVGPVAGGQEVNIIGNNFRENCVVEFGGKPAQVKKVAKQGTVLKAVTPPGSGAVAVTVKIPGVKQVASRSRAYYFGGGVGAGFYRFRHGLGTVWFWIQIGGWIMYPILVLSIVALALIFHGLLAIRETQLIPDRLVEDVAEYLSNGHLDSAADYCRKKACAFGRIVLTGVQKADQPASIIREAMAAAGAREAEHLQQKINYLNNIGVVAPMLGLFGTVWGLQLAFQEIAGAGAQHQVLAAAIAVALNTTVAGLIVGIGSFVGYFLFRGRVVRLISTMEILAEEMAERIIQRKGAEE